MDRAGPPRSGIFVGRLGRRGEGKVGWISVTGRVIRSNAAVALGLWLDRGTEFSGGWRDGLAIELAVPPASTFLAGEGQWRTRGIAERERDMKREGEKVRVPLRESVREADAEQQRQQSWLERLEASAASFEERWEIDSDGNWEERRRRWIDSDGELHVGSVYFPSDSD